MGMYHFCFAAVQCHIGKQENRKLVKMQKNKTERERERERWRERRGENKQTNKQTYLCVCVRIIQMPTESNRQTTTKQHRPVRCVV